MNESVCGAITGIAAMILVIGAPTAIHGQAAVRPGALVLRDVNVLPMDRDTLLEHQTIVIENGRVTQMGSAREISLPSGAQVIEATGQYLLPGLVDSHVHLRDTTELGAYLAHGITAVLQLSGPQGAISDLLTLRDEIASGQRLGPRLLLGGRLIDGNPPIFRNAADVVTTPAEGRAIVRSRQSAGYDFVKIYNNVPRAVLSAIVDEAHRRGMLVFGHVPRAEGREGALEHVLAQRMDVIAHGEEYFFSRFYVGIEQALEAGIQPAVDTAGLDQVVAATRQAGTVVSPNLSFVRQTRQWLNDPDVIFADPEFDYLAPRRRDSWRRNHPGTRSDLDAFDRRERAKAKFLDLLTLRLHEGGVPLIAGTDASFAGLYPGASLHTELAELVRVGLSRFEALRTATAEPGQLMMRITRSVEPMGVIRPGAIANLILLDGDPRADLNALRSLIGVVLAGRWVDRATIQSLRPTWPS